MKLLCSASKSLRLQLPLLLLPLALLSLEPGCVSSQVYPQHPLAQEILSARPGHDGKLTNQACQAYQGDKCLQWHTVEYDVSDPNFQTEANKLNITCSIGGKRHKICMGEKDSSGKPMNGFCRITYKKNCFLFCPAKRVVDFFPIEPYQNVLDANVKCYNHDVYPEGVL